MKISDDFGRGCEACDHSGHVCSDDDEPQAHPGVLRPWDGLSTRADACDHGGGMPCPECSPIGIERAAAIVEGLTPEHRDGVARAVFGDDAVDDRWPSHWTPPLAEPDLVPLPDLVPSDVDEPNPVREAVRRDRGDLNRAEVADLVNQVLGGRR